MNDKNVREEKKERKRKNEIKQMSRKVRNYIMLKTKNKRTKRIL